MTPLLRRDARIAPRGAGGAQRLRVRAAPAA